MSNITVIAIVSPVGCFVAGCSSAQDNGYDNSSDRSSVFSTPSPQTQPRTTHSGTTGSSSLGGPPPPVPTFPPPQAETHHPSLRRRKWLDKPSPTSMIRQSTLEKSLSLQAELTQQRPLSMLVPYGGNVPNSAALPDGNAIVNQARLFIDYPRRFWEAKIAWWTGSHWQESRCGDLAVSCYSLPCDFCRRIMLWIMGLSLYRGRPQGC